jgi:hypothetical protein
VQRGRGSRRYKARPAGWQHDDRGAEQGVEGDADMQQRGKQRRPRNKRRRRGDVEMEDAEGGGYGGEEVRCWQGRVALNGGCTKARDTPPTCLLPLLLPPVLQELGGSAPQRFRRASDDERPAGGVAAAAPIAVVAMAGPPREPVSYDDL